MNSTTDRHRNLATVNGAFDIPNQAIQNIAHHHIDKVSSMESRWFIPFTQTAHSLDGSYKVAYIHRALDINLPNANIYAHAGHRG